MLVQPDTQHAACLLESMFLAAHVLAAGHRCPVFIRELVAGKPLILPFADQHSCRQLQDDT